jgi:hypothetical protein
MRFAAALFAALAVASCAFDSEEALFSANEAVFPFETGAAYNWRPSGEGEEPLIVRFQRAGVHYELRVIDAEPDDRAMRALFIPVGETYEDDYIGQVALDGEGRGFAYVFLWPTGEGRFRAILHPGAFDRAEPGSITDYCTPAPYSGCTFRSAADVRRFYLNVLYPAFANGQTPARFLDLASASATEAGKPQPR